MAFKIKAKEESKTVLRFEVTAEQLAKASKEIHETFQALAEEQLKDKSVREFVFTNDDGSLSPYLGAIDGGITYTFTQTGLGVITTVEILSGTKHAKTVDITDYENW